MSAQGRNHEERNNRRDTEISTLEEFHTLLAFWGPWEARFWTRNPRLGQDLVLLGCIKTLPGFRHVSSWEAQSHDKQAHGFFEIREVAGAATTAKFCANKNAVKSVHTPGIGRQKSLLLAMPPHIRLLIRADTQSGPRLSSTQQNKSRLTVLGKIDPGVRLIHFASAFQSPRAGQAISLMAKRRQGDSGRQGGVPNVFVPANTNRAFSVGEQQSDSERLRA